jgi:hypothetical protein
MRRRTSTAINRRAVVSTDSTQRRYAPSKMILLDALAADALLLAGGGL